MVEMFRTIPLPKGAPGWRRFLTFVGPGYLVAVGYMDPGNWATSLAGGSRFGYALLSVALLSNLMAILLQALCARLAVGSGRDLASPSRLKARPTIRPASATIASASAARGRAAKRLPRAAAPPAVNPTGWSPAVVCSGMGRGFCIVPH